MCECTRRKYGSVKTDKTKKALGKNNRNLPYDDAASTADSLFAVMASGEEGPEFGGDFPLPLPGFGGLIGVTRGGENHWMGGLMRCLTCFAA